MLNTYNVNHGDATREIINALRLGRTIEAIKQHRTLYGTGLKESKDAIEALRDALGLVGAAYVPPQSAPQFIVFSRYHESDYDYSRYSADDRADADRFASEIIDSRDEVIVAQVVAKSVTVRTMKAV
jgi:hypothetical protein